MSAIENKQLNYNQFKYSLLFFVFLTNYINSFNFKSLSTKNCDTILNFLIQISARTKLMGNFILNFLVILP